MNQDPFAAPDDEPNPFAIRPEITSGSALNPYAPTLHLSETEGLESDVDAYRRRYLTHEASIKSVGSLYLIPGVLMVIFFVFLAGASAFEALTGQANGMQGAGWIEAILTIGIFGGLGLVQIYAGHGLQRFRISARRIVTLFSVFGLLMFPLGTLINGYVLYLLQGQKGKVVFSEEYQEVIRQTPHIQYKTSIIVKIFVVILIAVISLGIVAAFMGV